MNILVGLGNPGKKYSKTKHNFGFWVIDQYVAKYSLTYKSGKGEYLLAKKEQLICLKPTTFMNNSGLALMNVKQFFNIEPNNILVIYDDIDLDLGTIRYRKNGGTGGHKGIESIIYHLNSEKFNRLRIGIAADENIRPSEKYVLSPFNEKDEKLKIEMIERACESIDFYLSHDMIETMNKYNKIKQGKN
tara:strand:- start:413 stop:979 length:567 start_codon:yes stop_codon:yes gene_type:complete